MLFATRKMPRHAPLAFTSGSASHAGTVREANEDEVLVRLSEGIFVVADGIGGLSRGRVASHMVCHGLANATLPSSFDETLHAVLHELAAAHQRLLVLKDCDPEDAMVGTTVACLIVRDRRAAIVWSGDSRVYRLRGDILAQLTSDHSLLAESAALRGVSTSEISDIRSNIITRAIGVTSSAEPDVVEVDVQPGDIFLLCTDGLHNSVSHRDITALLYNARRDHASAGDIAALLQSRALAARARDNVSSVVVSFSGT